MLDLPDDDEEEDEETLQLKLQAIEARLKLKKLHKAKAERSATSGADSDGGRESRRAGTTARLQRSRATPPVETPAVEVPLSPIEDRRAPELPKSPARVLLGIDKGLRAQDVSLKRAASLRNRTTAPKDQFGSELNRPAISRGSSYVSQSSSTASQSKSFSERIAESRLTDKQRQEKEERIQKSRSRGFGLDVNTKGGAQDEEDIWTASPAVSGGANGSGGGVQGTGDMGPPATKPPSGALRTRRSMANINNTASTPSDSSKLSNRPTSSRSDSQQSISSRSTVPTPSTAHHPSKTPSSATEDPPPSDTTSYDPFSNLHLTKRHIPHTTLTRTFEDKALYPIPKLLAEVKGPTYDPPDIESDYIIFGILASKSAPLAHRNGPQIASTGDPDDEKQRSKYMVLRLTDLKWELDLFLFGSGFERWWKLTPGTVLAVLNPGIMPPRNRDTGAFSLKLGSSEDTVLEIGVARDLGFCKSVKKDGKECLSWIDARKTEFCEFHVGLQVEKMKRGRMEVNTMVGWSGGREKEGPRGRRLGGGMFGARGKDGAGKGDGLRKEGRFRDELTHETAYILPGQYSVGSAAKLLDADINGFERGRDPKELHRKRLAEQEKERELADRLAKSGSGMGSEYMRVRTDGQAKSSLDGSGAAASLALHDPPDARALGLLGNKASDVSLNPVKRKRAQGSGTHSEPMGWGGAFKTGLLSPMKKVGGLRSGDTVRETSPAKKKARLLLDGKGIREPGRDSLGIVAVKDEDDDDDLDII